MNSILSAVSFFFSCSTNLLCDHLWARFTIFLNHPSFVVVVVVLDLVLFWIHVTDQALLIRCSVKNLSIWHVLSITAFCMRIYRSGRTFSSSKLSCNLLRTVGLLIVDNIYWYYRGQVQLLYSCLLFFLGAFTKLGKSNSQYCHACPSVRMEQLSFPLDGYLMKFDIWVFFGNPSRKLKFDKKCGYFT